MPEPMQLFRMHPGSGTRCAGTIAMVTRDDVKAATAVSWLMADRSSFLQPGEYVAQFIVQGNILVIQRNECIQQMDGDWILFIDDDMTFQPDAVSRIIETQRRTGADIVGGLCFQRGEPHQPTLYRAKGDLGYTFMEDWPDGLVDVDGTGMAFCLITRQALDKIVKHVVGPDAEFPSREERKGMPPFQFFQWGSRWGEDFAFCRAAKEAGCWIVVDTSIEIGHIGDRIIGKRDFWTSVLLRGADAQAGRERQGGELGIPILSPRDAAGKLGIDL